MTQLTNALSNLLGRPVIDKTGFTGTFDVKLDFSRDGLAIPGFGPPPGGPPPGGPQGDAAIANADGPPSIFTAIQEQLGLKLESQKGPGEILVIDHAEKATEN